MANQASSAHTSTSESVKTRPRPNPGGRYAQGLSGQPADSLSVPEKSSRKPTRKKIKTEPQHGIDSNLTFQPIAPAHYDELSAIWPADKRIPSAASRRAWSLARNLKPDLVNRWWYRRKLVAKKLRFKIPPGTYELAIGAPPVISVVVKGEIEEDEEDAMLGVKREGNPEIDSTQSRLERPSSPCSEVTTMTFYDSTLPSSDSTSNTAFSSISISKPASTLVKRAYTHAPSSPARFLSPPFDSIHTASSSLPPSSPPLAAPSSPDLKTKVELDPDVQTFALEPGSGLPSCGLTLDFYERTESRIDDHPRVRCNQGVGGLSGFTCSLCIQAHISPPDDPSSDLTLPYAAPLPQTLDSLRLMTELSAIPYLSYLDSLSRSGALSHHMASSPLLPGTPVHHYLDYDDPRLELGSGPRLGMWCLGGNNYSPDGFFVGPCRCRCFGLASNNDDFESSGAELWQFGFAPTNLSELEVGLGTS